MAEPPVTRVTLLARIRDGRDADAWREFVQIYGPVDAGEERRPVSHEEVGRRVGPFVIDHLQGRLGPLEPIERDGVVGLPGGENGLEPVQKIPLRFGEGVGKLPAGEEPGLDRPRGTGDTDAHERLDATAARDTDGPEADWEREYQRRLSGRAMELVKDEFQPATWQAFWETAVDGRPAAEVGAGLKMSPGAVYVAKSRVLARLRDEVKKMMDAEDAG